MRVKILQLMVDNSRNGKVSVSSGDIKKISKKSGLRTFRKLAKEFFPDYVYNRETQKYTIKIKKQEVKNLRGYFYFKKFEIKNIL